MKINYEVGDRVVVMKDEKDIPTLWKDHHLATHGYQRWGIRLTNDVDEDGTGCVVIEVPNGEGLPDGVFVIQQTEHVTEDNYPIWRVVNA